MECRATLSQTVLPCQLVQTDAALQAVCRCLSGGQAGFSVMKPRVQAGSPCSFSLLYDTQRTDLTTDSKPSPTWLVMP